MNDYDNHMHTDRSEPIDWQGEEREAESRGDAEQDERWLKEHGMYDKPPVRVSLEVNDVQLRALMAAGHGEPLSDWQRGNLLTLAIHIGRQMQERRAKVAELVGDMGAAELVR